MSYLVYNFYIRISLMCHHLEADTYLKLIA